MRPPIIPKTVPILEHDSKQTKILKQCFNHLVEYREPKSGRIAISLFMCLPSRKEFPEYFEMIEKPISMYEIRKRIESGLYSCEDDCIADFKLMFHNCRFFNEELSQIFYDAVNLESMLLKKYGELRQQYQPQQPAEHLNGHQKPFKHQTTPEESPKPIIEHQKPIKHQIAHRESPKPLMGHHETPKRQSGLTPKKRLLTGYIIYAAEVRKEYVDKHPNQDFGFVSRLIGHDWKKLSLEARKAYDQRAAAHNKKFQEKILRESMLAAAASPHLDSPIQSAIMTNGTTNGTKNMMTKLARKHVKKSSLYPHPDQAKPANPATQNLGSNYPIATVTTETATQTARIRFVKPPPTERPDPTKWLGAGLGRHESAEAALWALRDFMLLDTATRRFNMQPYLHHGEPSESAPQS